jgi:6-phosphogluconolactonase
MKLVEYADREMMAMSLANKLAGDLATFLTTSERALLAVPGGTTPGPVFDSLCAADLEWERVTIVLTDERWVPEDSPRSNTRLIREHLLVERAARAQFLPLYTGAPSPEDAFGQLAEQIEPLLPISVLLLGMGEDMHTASLFPGDPRLDAALRDDAPNVMAMHPPGEPEPRITLTGPVLADALEKHVVIAGEEKRAALERAVQLGDPLQAPIVAVLNGATVHWAA